MTGPEQGGDHADIGAQAMATTASLDEVTTISTAQTMNGLSTLLVSEGLSKLVRDMLTPGAVTPPAAHQVLPIQALAGPGPEKTERKDQSADGSAPAEKDGSPKPVTSREDLVGMSSQALGELLTRSMVSRIVDLNTVNTYLALATSEQLRQWGKQMAAGVSSSTADPGPTSASISPAPALPANVATQAVPGYPPAFLYGPPPASPPVLYGPPPAQPSAQPVPAFPFPPLRRQSVTAWGSAPYPGWTGPWAYPPVPGIAAPGAGTPGMAYPRRPAGYPGYYFLPSRMWQ